MIPPLAGSAYILMRFFLGSFFFSFFFLIDVDVFFFYFHPFFLPFFFFILFFTPFFFFLLYSFLFFDSFLVQRLFFDIFSRAFFWCPEVKKVGIFFYILVCIFQQIAPSRPLQSMSWLVLGSSSFPTPLCFLVGLGRFCYFFCYFF